ncbi:MAG TPA: response regulator [Opitutae bacterium]|nr:response regulator [Opitutae bacterium]
MNDTPDTEPTRILIIDDEASFTRMVKLNMQNAGNYVVETLNESLQARMVAKQFKPHIILLDVVMPEADGGDVATTLRESEQTKNIPIIFVSAMVSRKESHRGLYRSGGEYFLAKPVSSDLLVDAIHQVLNA